MAFSLKQAIEDSKDQSMYSGLRSKKVLIYGDNSCGKSKQCSRLPKPLFVCTEAGAGALNVPKQSCTKWSTFKEIVKELTNPKNLEENMALCETIVIDTLPNLVDLSERAICNQYGVSDLSQITGKVNGYVLARKDFASQIDLLTSVGYCVAFISHSEVVEIVDEITGETIQYTQPKGSNNPKSSLSYIKNLCDFTILVIPQGLDQDFNEKMSIGLLKRTKTAFARSRFLTNTFIKPFTAENLVKEIEEAVKKSAEEQGTTVGEYQEEQKGYTKEDYYDIIKPYFAKLSEVCVDELANIIEGELGAGRKISETTDEDIIKLDNIYNKLVTKALALGLTI